MRDPGDFGLGIPNRGETQAFPGRSAGTRVIVFPSGVLGVPGAPALLAAVGGVGDVRPWNAWISQVMAPVSGINPPLLAVSPSGGGTGFVPGIWSAQVGIARWTIDGAQFLAEFDVTHACRLTLVADRLELWVADESGLNDVLVPAAGQAMVGGITPGSAASPSPVLRTRYAFASVENEAGTAFVPTVVTVPPFARTVTPLVAPIGTLGGYTLNFLSTAGVVIGTREYPERVYGVGPGSQIEGEAAPLVLPNDCRAISLISGPGVAQARTSHRFIFGLYL